MSDRSHEMCRSSPKSGEWFCDLHRKPARLVKLKPHHESGPWSTLSSFLAAFCRKFVFISQKMSATVRQVVICIIKKACDKETRIRVEFWERGSEQVWFWGYLVCLLVVGLSLSFLWNATKLSSKRNHSAGVLFPKEIPISHPNFDRKSTGWSTFKHLHVRTSLLVQSKFSTS